MALKIIVDTMHIVGILSDTIYLSVAEAIDQKKIDAVISVISLTELIKILGKYDLDKTKTTITQLKSSNLEIKPLDTSIAEEAGYIRLKYNIPTADSLIGATGIICKADHILSNDDHFNSIKSLIKPIDLNKLLKLIKKL